jgi:hypothetical protein
MACAIGGEATERRLRIVARVLFAVGLTALRSFALIDVVERAERGLAFEVIFQISPSGIAVAGRYAAQGRFEVGFFFQFGCRVWVGGIQKGQKPLDLVERLLAELGEAPERIFPLPLLVGQARWLLTHQRAALVNLSHETPHSLGQACRGVRSTTAGRLIFKLGKGIAAS